MTTPAIRRAYYELHMAVFLFGFTGILGRLITLEATLLVWYRMWMTAAIMFVYVWLIGKWKRLPLDELLRIVLFSSTITLHWILFYGTIKYAGVSVAMICLSAITLFTALLEPLILKRPFSKIQLLFSALVIVGVWLMARGQQGGITGVLLGLASAFFSSLFTVLNKTIVHRYDSRLLTFYELFSGVVLLTLFLPLIDYVMPVDRFLPSAGDWGYLLLLSFFCTVVAFNLSLRSLKHLTPFTVNLAINLEPVYGIALAFVVFKEYKMLGPGFYLGAICILFSVSGEIAWNYLRQRKGSLLRFPG